jgi:hypothetical protein
MGRGSSESRLASPVGRPHVYQGPDQLLPRRARDHCTEQRADPSLATRTIPPRHSSLRKRAFKRTPRVDASVGRFFHSPQKGPRVPHTPDFLWSFVGSLNFLRLSLKKGAHAVLSRAAYRKFGVSRSFFARYGRPRLFAPDFFAAGTFSQPRLFPQPRLFRSLLPLVARHPFHSRTRRQWANAVSARRARRKAPPSMSGSSGPDLCFKHCSSNAWRCRFITQNQTQNQHNNHRYTATVLSKAIFTANARSNSVKR